MLETLCKKQWLPWLPSAVITKCKIWKKSVITYITLKSCRLSWTKWHFWILFWYSFR